MLKGQPLVERFLETLQFIQLPNGNLVESPTTLTGGLIGCTFTSYCFLNLTLFSSFVVVFFFLKMMDGNITII